MFKIAKAEFEKQLECELLEGEKLLWTGQPGTGVNFVLRDIILIPFGIIWFIFALFWESIVLFAAPFFDKIAFSLIGIPFVLFGFYLFIGRFWYDAKRRAKTIYGITTNRVIIKLIGDKKIVDVFDIQLLPMMEINEKSDGSGTIKLDADPPRYSAWKTDYVRRKTTWAIENVQQVRTINDLILHQQQALNKVSLARHLAKVTSLAAAQK